jgi:hypothetical protein
MHCAKQMTEHCAVTHPGVKEAKRRRLRRYMPQLIRGPLSNLPFFIAGVNESEVFLAIIVKPKRPWFP